ncbi:MULTISPECIES: 3-hydroxyacyl-CoA dehydrogenase NAD-binding domain-containing protein [unclassified Aureimonas]|uniref:3-hydroxyacyl-CoA dehydrogenase NAD-binding domain-containing protein n=1 Tax=unclassified Aureimonas TaxID=2615206 RepID=UPI0006FFF87D|nr:MULTISPECIES: 3-hydroxyacyl-CoA dehydrogenase NAD-binding domain-containing protein [unclassified Aureimonas]KQT70016.1 3-hydroxyacyl-CoA dehydrogenase [Aureimonas sp. Leaf427]KQT75829.1 3-hydroxyacyl-CoA dehydrogenase [Aureimonas sp. Leaf460]
MTIVNEVARLETDDGIAVLILDHPPVNVLSKILREGIEAGLRRALSDDAVDAVVILCEGRTFISGADIREFGRPPEGPPLEALNALIEGAEKPVIAALHGTVLGGGFELALSAHARIAMPSTLLGLPEIRLGLVPGAGGTQRLPRLLGLSHALDMILSGEPMGAARAKALGAIDEIAHGALTPAAIAFARRFLEEGRPLRRIRDETEKLQAPGGNGAVFDAVKARHARILKGNDAARGAINAVYAATQMPFEEGLARERQIFGELLAGPQSKAQRYLFAATRAAAKLPGLPPGTRPRRIARIGVVGAGTMGGGLATAFLAAGLPVTLVETGREALDRGVSTLRAGLEASAAKGKLRPEEVGQRMARLTPSLALADLADCDLVIEAVFETMAVKREVFAKLDAIVRPDTILATNTSYLDVNQIAAASRLPERVVGLHFFTPVPVMKLVEVVSARTTAPDVLATAMALARTLGKVAVSVGASDGFVGNRMLRARRVEADRLILEGAMPWDVDRVFTGFGLPMGPFQIADLAGLDLGWSRETSKGRTLRARLCEVGRRGQKSKAGFYDYDDERRGRASPVVEELIAAMSEEAGLERRSITDREILERCLYPMINEGAKIIEERVASRASDIDVVWVNGYGWPPTMGGPMFWADAHGLRDILETLRRYEERLGEAFRPAPLLERLVEEEGSFTGLF